jgi:3-oxoacyl-[acyl-carrier-protein] synthase-3
MESTADAVADGRYDAKENDNSGYLGVRVADNGPAVELAVTAANLAVQRSGRDAEDFTLVVHSCIAHQGLDDFASGAYVQSRTVRGRATALEIRQASNGGMAALDLAAAYLSARPEPTSALLSTSDRFVPPAFDRYRTASGLLLGDGGTGLVLTRGSGVARLLSTILVGDTTYQGMQIGDEPWTEAPAEAGWPVDTQARVDAFIAAAGPDAVADMVQSISGIENETMKLAIDDAGLSAADITWWVFPNMGGLTDWYALEELGVDESHTTWDWGRRAGHLGAGDQFAGLAQLFETRKVRVGDRILLNGAGTGFSFGSAVIEVLAEPNWQDTTTHTEGHRA